jgi:thiol-disulfide isomerase/thioredoxin
MVMCVTVLRGGVRLAAGSLLALSLGSCATLPAAGPPQPASAPGCPAGGARMHGLVGVRLPCLARPRRTSLVPSAARRPELVNIWASWCDPCRRELPLLERAYRAADQRVRFVGVDVRDSRSRALAFLGGHRVSFPQVFDEDGALARAFRFAGVPDTVVVDPSGRVVYRHAGQLDAASLAAALAAVGVHVPPVG